MHENTISKGLVCKVDMKRGNQPNYCESCTDYIPATETEVPMDALYENAMSPDNMNGYITLRDISNNTRPQAESSRLDTLLIDTSRVILFDESDVK